MIKICSIFKLFNDYDTVAIKKKDEKYIIKNGINLIKLSLIFSSFTISLGKKIIKTKVVVV